jgi:hypothetical protein
MVAILGYFENCGSQMIVTRVFIVPSFGECPTFDASGYGSVVQETLSRT